jgi:PAS domain S-box-containing protein
MAIVHPECRGVVGERIMNASSVGQVNPCHEEKVLRLDGTPVDVEAVGTHLMYQGRSAVQVILRDITARKQAEQALRESEETLRNLM